MKISAVLHSSLMPFFIINFSYICTLSAVQSGLVRRSKSLVPLQQKTLNHPQQLDGKSPSADTQNFYPILTSTRSLCTIIEVYFAMQKSYWMEFLLNFKISTKFQNVDQISEFQPKFRSSTKFQNFNQISEFQLVFLVNHVSGRREN